MNFYDRAVEVLSQSIARQKSKLSELEGQLKDLSREKIDDAKGYIAELRKIKKEVKEELVVSQKKVVVALEKVDSHIASLRQPKDGEDAVVDYDYIENVIDKKVQSKEPKEVDYNRVDEKIEYEVSKIPRPKDAKVDYTQINRTILQNFPEKAILEKLNKKIPKYEKPIGIKKIYVKSKYLHIETTDGKTVKFKISYKNINMFGSGGTGIARKERFTNLEPVPDALGGIDAGTTFNQVPVVDVLNQLLYPFQKPAFTSFTVDGQANQTFELGYTYVGGEKTFEWTTSNNENIIPDTITLNGVSDLPNDGIEFQDVLDITSDTPSTSQFTISGINIENAPFTRAITLSWSHKRLWGVSPNTEVDDAELLTFSSEFATNHAKKIDYDCTGGRYFYFAFPTSFGDLNDTTINSISWNDWILVQRDFVNINGVSILMNIYRSFNLLNGTITVDWN